MSEINREFWKDIEKWMDKNKKSVTGISWKTTIEELKTFPIDCLNYYEQLALNIAISEMERLENYRTKLSNAYGECDTLLDTVVDGLVKQAEEHKIGQPKKARLLTDEDVDLWEQSKSDREKLEKIEQILDNTHDEQYKANSEYEGIFKEIEQIVKG